MVPRDRGRHCPTLVRIRDFVLYARVVGIDAIALLRPKNKDLLREHSELLVPLEGGSVLFRTLMRYRDFEAEPATARAFLESELGCALEEVQDDARGVFMFPDVAEPRATTYDDVVEEIGEDGFWVPLDGSRSARARATAATKRSKRREPRQNPFSLFVGLEEPPTDAPVFSGDVAELEQLAGTFIRISPGTEVWSLLVRRRTPLPSVAGLARGTAILADESTMIHGKYMETLDDVSARLANEYAPWIAEHDDPRGVPVFRYGACHHVEAASSYADAVTRLGDQVRWLVVKTKTSKRVKPAQEKNASKKGPPRAPARPGRGPSRGGETGGP